VLHREGGETRAVRLVVGVDAGAESQAVRSDVQDLAATVEGPGLTATATGTVVVRATVQDELLRTVVTTLFLTLLAVALLLMAVYRVTYGSATLGLVTVAPVGLTVAWVVGAMTVLGLPLSVMTALVASLTIGIGVDYTIHVSERYVQELEAGRSPEAALSAAIGGTGAAILGSAVTTASGFGVLGLAVLPSLQQFGVITALTIVFAFLASVLVLPSMLVLWTRLVARPVGSDDERAARGPSPAPDD
jgi:predicted RND superfamily exporter protein